MPIISTFYGIIVPIGYKDAKKDLLHDSKLAVQGVTLFSILPFKEKEISGFSISSINIVIVL